MPTGQPASLAFVLRRLFLNFVSKKTAKTNDDKHVRKKSLTAFFSHFPSLCECVLPLLLLLLSTSMIMQYKYLSVQRQHEKITHIKPELTLSSLHVV